MSNSTLVITLQSPRSVADLARYIKSTSAPRDEARALAHLFEKLASGLEAGNFDVQTSAAAPVRASGTVTLTYASISANDTVTLGGTALTCVTGTPTSSQFKKVTDGPTTAANLAATINAHTTLSKLVSATAAAGVVTVKALMPGAIANQFTMATSNGTGFVLSAAVLANGAGGAETVALNYGRGL